MAVLGSAIEFTEARHVDFAIPALPDENASSDATCRDSSAWKI